MFFFSQSEFVEYFVYRLKIHIMNYIHGCRILASCIKIEQFSFEEKKKLCHLMRKVIGPTPIVIKHNLSSIYKTDVKQKELDLAIGNR